MKYQPFCALFFLAASASVCAQRPPYIDPAMIPVEEARRKFVTEQCHKKPFNQQMHCQESAREKAKTLFPLRGTPEYAQMHYALLSAAEAKAKVAELYQQARSARSLQIKPEPGEVSAIALEGEAQWIQQNILHQKPLETRR